MALRDDLVFIVQVIILMSVIVASIINLSLGIGPERLWTALLCSCLGIILPSPKMTCKRI